MCKLPFFKNDKSQHNNNYAFTKLQPSYTKEKPNNTSPNTYKLLGRHVLDVDNGPGLL